MLWNDGCDTTRFCVFCRSMCKLRCFISAAFSASQRLVSKKWSLSPSFRKSKWFNDIHTMMITNWWQGNEWAFTSKMKPIQSKKAFINFSIFRHGKRQNVWSFSPRKLIRKRSFRSATPIFLPFLLLITSQSRKLISRSWSDLSHSLFQVHRSPTPHPTLVDLTWPD